MGKVILHSGKNASITDFSKAVKIGLKANLGGDLVESAVFHHRLILWKALEDEREPLTLRDLEKRSGINRGLWSSWLAGNGKYRSQQMPTAQQWDQLRLNMGIGWYYVFEDVYKGITEIRLTDRICPICNNEFHAYGRQLYDKRFCRFVAQCRREDEKRKTPAAALRAV